MKYNEISTFELLGGLNTVESQHAPKSIFFLGDPKLAKTPGVSIVGSRNCTPDGKRRATKLAKMLVEAQKTIVSGLAKGIDTAAHVSAIKFGGRTIAVIGTPLDRMYPAENRELQEKIAKDHLVVSQFAVGKRVYPSNFVTRNRTMALISRATVIVEASDSSGSISQGWEALRLGRPLFICQSVTQDQALSWPAEMMKYGASILNDDTFENLIEVLPSQGEIDLVSI